jgi:hypothetical protein
MRYRNATKLSTLNILMRMSSVFFESIGGYSLAVEVPSYRGRIVAQSRLLAARTI